MRTVLPLSAIALILSLAPASAMCGGGQQAQSSGQAGMSCGRPAQSTQVEDPFGLKVQPQNRPQTGMMCPCCRGMAMMQGGGMKMDGDDPHKGMDMSPKQ
jgi:hypothetical protein